MNYSKRNLFGGAITSNLPTDWKDLSDARQIPDNQECFQDSFVTPHPQLLVIEILERQEHVDDRDAASFFFNEIAERNDELQSQNDFRFHTFKQDDIYSATLLACDVSVTARENTIQVCSGFGFQKAAMGRDHDDYGNSRRMQQEIKQIRIDIVVIRLPVQETDLIVTLSKPVDFPNPNEEIYFDISSTKTSPILNRIISTLQICDWKLFG